MILELTDDMRDFLTAVVLNEACDIRRELAQGPNQEYRDIAQKDLDRTEQLLEALTGIK